MSVTCYKEHYLVAHSNQLVLSVCLVLHLVLCQMHSASFSLQLTCLRLCREWVPERFTNIPVTTQQQWKTLRVNLIYLVPEKALRRGLQSCVFHGSMCSMDPDLEDLHCVLIHLVVESLVKLHHLLVLSVLPDKSLWGSLDTLSFVEFFDH